MRALLLVLCGLIAASTCFAAVKAEIVSGFETSAPLELGYLKVLLENNSLRPEEVVLKSSSDWYRQTVELPPNSKKAVPFVLNSVVGELDVWAGSKRLTTARTGIGFNGQLILVISEQDTGLRRLKRNAGMQTQAREVIYCRPRDLPEAWYAYGNAWGSLLVVHPGGFDAMNSRQWDALVMRIKLFDPTVLVSEGRPDAFSGTPLEQFVPGQIWGVDSFSDWPEHLLATERGPSALVNINPAVDTTTPLGLKSDFRGIVSRVLGGNRVTYLAFDYSAPPVRGWASTPFWEAQMRPGSPWFLNRGGLESELTRILTRDAAWKTVGWSSSLLAALFLVVGYVGMIIGSRRFLAAPGKIRAWVTPATMIAAVFLLCLPVALLFRMGAGSSYFERSILVPMGDTNFYRTGVFGLRGEGRLKDLKSESTRFFAGSPRFDYVSSHLESMNPSNIIIEPGQPPVIRNAALQSAGVMQIQGVDILDTTGTLIINAKPATGAYNFDIEIINNTPFRLKSPRLSLNGWIGPVDDVEAGESRSENVTLSLISASSIYLNRQEEVDEALNMTLTRASNTAPVTGIGATGYLMAWVDAPPMYDLRGSHTTVLVAEVNRR